MMLFERFRKAKLLGLVAIVMCVALLAGACSKKEESNISNDSDTAIHEEAINSTEEATDSTEESGKTAEPGVYADLKQYDNTIELSPIPGGITDSTVLPTFKCTFGDMTNEAQNALEEGRVFPKDFFRDLTACTLISEDHMTGRDHDAIMYALCNLAAMANEFWSLDLTLKNVVYELAEDGQVAKTIYNVHFGAADKDGQIVYDNPNRKWYLDTVEYSGSLDSEETLATWWTIFDIAEGNN